MANDIPFRPSTCRFRTFQGPNRGFPYFPISLFPFPSTQSPLMFPNVNTLSHYHYRHGPRKIPRYVMIPQYYYFVRTYLLRDRLASVL